MNKTVYGSGNPILNLHDNNYYYGYVELDSKGNALAEYAVRKSNNNKWLRQNNIRVIIV